MSSSSYTIAVANSKGGVGKSTVAMLLAGALSANLRTVVADSDPQGTASLWSGAGTFPAPVVPVTDNALNTLRALATEFQVVIVDCPPNVDSPLLRAALDAATLLLIPCAPEPADVWATKILLELCRVQYPNLAVRVVLNKVPVATALSRDTLAGVTAEEWPLAKAQLGLRTAYKEAMALGGTIDSVKGKGGRQARDELQALALETVMTAMSV
jgi:chromosome partitioning protein